METCKKEGLFCRLCQNVINDENYLEIEDTIREVLNVLLLKLDSDDKSKHWICTACSKKLFAAFIFKATCFDTDDVIFPYINDEGKLSLDLKEVYQKEKGIGPSKKKLKDIQICRLCFKFITEDYTSLLEVDTDIISIYIPEVNLNITKDPVVCMTCFNSLNTHGDFLKNCRENAQIVNIMNLAQYQLNASIKTEEIEIKCEETEQIKEETVESVELQEDRSESRGYKCTVCDYRTIKRDNLNRHLLRHRKDGIFCCDTCTYYTNDNYKLKRHLVTHKNPSEIEWYKCEECDYKGKLKSRLAAHMKMHKDPSKIKWYRCEECSYMCKNKHRLMLHMILHKNLKEADLYKCDKCDYKTKHKGCLKRHTSSVHREVYKYKCSKCSYHSQHLNVMKRHELRHKDPSEITWYECHSCGYRAKLKYSLTTHILKKKCFSRKCRGK